MGHPNDNAPFDALGALRGLAVDTLSAIADGDARALARATQLAAAVLRATDVSIVPGASRANGVDT